MSKKELNRVSVIESALSRKMTQVEASQRLSLSDRHVRRLVHNYREFGTVALVHKLRGRPSNRTIPETFKNQVLELYQKSYSDFQPTFATEKMLEINELVVNPETLRLWLAADGLWTVKARKAKHREWRERKDHFGEMPQFDGSHHDWFEGRGEKCVLLASRDDANNFVLARFYRYEGTKPVFDFWNRYIKRLGKPKAIYLDRHSTYKVNHKIALDEKTLTQFGRACEELGMVLVNAKSPEAKGRIENLFGTLQDRLVKELRLKGISTIEEANSFLETEFLPKFNQKFMVSPKKKTNFHQPLTAKDNLEKSFSIKSERLINNDFTIRFQGKWYQLEAVQPKLVLKRSKVIMEERLSGQLVIEQQGQSLNYKEINKEQIKQANPANLPALTSNPNNQNKARKPAANHPWRMVSRMKYYAKTGHF